MSPSNNVAWAEANLRTKWYPDASSHLTTINMGRKLGAVPTFLGRGAGSPSSTMWPGPRPASMPNVILIHPAVWPQYPWAENWGCVLFGELGHRLAQCGLGRGLLPYQVASRSIQPLGHNRHGPKIWGCAPFWGGESGSPSSTMWPGPRPTLVPNGILIHPAQPFRRNRHGPNIGGLFPFSGRAMSPSNNVAWAQELSNC